MSTAAMIDSQRLGLMLNELRLPTIKHIWGGDFAAQADKEEWPASRFLAALDEHKLAERDRRRAGPHLAEAHLPAGKTLDCFTFKAVLMISKAQIMTLCAGDGWLDQGPNRILFGPPAAAKAIWRRRSAWHRWKMVGERCSPAPPTSSNVCRSLAAN